MPKNGFSFFAGLQIRGDKYLYTIGGWNLAYLSSVHRLKLDNSTGEPEDGSSWFQTPSMIQERADHACTLTQYKWQYGIMVAGEKDVFAFLHLLRHFDIFKKLKR